VINKLALALNIPAQLLMVIALTVASLFTTMVQIMISMLANAQNLISGNGIKSTMMVFADVTLNLK
jgi:hypothetical protein